MELSPSSTYVLACDRCRVLLWCGEQTRNRTRLYTHDFFATYLHAFLFSHENHELRFVAEDDDRGVDYSWIWQEADGRCPHCDLHVTHDGECYKLSVRPRGVA